MILYRCFAWHERARARNPDGPLWFPRIFQGDGRHDNPDLYGCLYLSERPLSAIVEQLARFRGQPFVPSMLRRRGLPLALAELALPDDVEILDLDDAAVLRRERLRPSRVATRARNVTQPQARTLYQEHPRAKGLRWWSTFEALWMNVTVFDRAESLLQVQSVTPLAPERPAVSEAAQFLGLRMDGG